MATYSIGLHNEARGTKRLEKTLTIGTIPYPLEKAIAKNKLTLEASPPTNQTPVYC